MSILLPVLKGASKILPKSLKVAGKAATKGRYGLATRIVGGAAIKSSLQFGSYVAASMLTQLDKFGIDSYNRSNGLLNDTESSKKLNSRYDKDNSKKSNSKSKLDASRKKTTAESNAKEEFSNKSNAAKAKAKEYARSVVSELFGNDQNKKLGNSNINYDKSPNDILSSLESGVKLSTAMTAYNSSMLDSIVDMIGESAKDEAVSDVILESNLLETKKEIEARDELSKKIKDSQYIGNIRLLNDIKDQLLSPMNLVALASVLGKSLYDLFSSDEPNGEFTDSDPGKSSYNLFSSDEPNGESSTPINLALETPTGAAITSALALIDLPKTIAGLAAAELQNKVLSDVNANIAHQGRRISEVSATTGLGMYASVPAPQSIDNLSHEQKMYFDSDKGRVDMLNRSIQNENPIGKKGFLSLLGFRGSKDEDLNTKLYPEINWLRRHPESMYELYGRAPQFINKDGLLTSIELNNDQILEFKEFVKKLAFKYDSNFNQLLENTSIDPSSEYNEALNLRHKSTLTDLDYYRIDELNKNTNSEKGYDTKKKSDDKKSEPNLVVAQPIVNNNNNNSVTVVNVIPDPYSDSGIFKQ